jgi:hypothetical protein
MTVRLTKPSFNFRSKLNELDFGVVPYNKMPTGSCIQFKSTDPVSDNVSITSETTMLTLNFEPILSNSKLLIYVEYGRVRNYVAGNSRARLQHDLKRDGTDIYNLGETPQYKSLNFNSSGVEIDPGPINFTYIDQAKGTQSRQYTATWQSVDAAAFNTGGANRTMRIWEYVQ